MSPQFSFSKWKAFIPKGTPSLAGKLEPPASSLKVGFALSAQTPGFVREVRTCWAIPFHRFTPVVVTEVRLGPRAIHFPKVRSSEEFRCMQALQFV